MLRVVVVEGPDSGQSRTFHMERVTLGNNPRNDLRLSDDMVSRFHGLVEVLGEGEFVYHDLGSLNGSVLESGSKTYTLHNRRTPQSIQVSGTARLYVGQTVIEIAREDAQARALQPEPAAPPKKTVVGSVPRDLVGNATQDRIVRRVTELPDGLTARIGGASDRLQIVFKVTKELNGLNDFEQILHRVADATFEMFPLANFFAIAVPREDDDSGAALGHRDDRIVPVFTRLREGDGPKELIVSQSLLEQVVERRESILFVRDKLFGQDMSQSIVAAEITACLAAPLIGQRRLMGVMQVDSRGRSGIFTYDDLDLFAVLASSTAFAMERAKLSQNIYQMFEAFVSASVAAIEARDPTTAGHSQRVADYTVMTAMGINALETGPLASIQFSTPELTELRYAALLHDFGKIGVSEEVLQKASRLMPGTYTTVKQRIETIKAIRQREILASHYQQLVREGRTPGPADMAAIDARVRAENARLASFGAVIDRLQEPRSLDVHDLRAIEEMRRFTYRDNDGDLRPLVSAEEAVDLSIQHGTLNPGEMKHMREHAPLSRKYLSQIPWSEELSRIPCIAGDHHEKLDGSGYPRGLRADQLLPQVRILTIADIYDAVTASDRPYKKAQPFEMASEVLRKDAAAGKLDPALVEFFLSDIVPAMEDQQRPRERATS